jgi:hypothetical protein
LPFPKADASKDVQFKPEFGVSLEIDSDLGKPTNYFAAVAKYGSKTVKQFVMGGAPKFLLIMADPVNNTHFSADMLVNLGQEELSMALDDAGTLDIYVYRITDVGSNQKRLTINQFSIQLVIVQD